MGSPMHFAQDDTHKIQQEVRLLFQSMSNDFRDHLMKSFLWTQDNLENYLSREMLLEGNPLKDAYSHLESLLARIEGYASEKPSTPFPGYEEWVNHEYRTYKTSLREDKEDIERLMDEGGVVSPGKTSPVDTMEDDTLAHYNQRKSEHEQCEIRSLEANKLMHSAHYKQLQKYASKMCKAIMDSIHRA